MPSQLQKSAKKGFRKVFNVWIKLHFSNLESGMVDVLMVTKMPVGGS